MLRAGPITRAVIAWLLATLATTLAFSRDSETVARAVSEFVVLAIFNLAFTAVIAFAAYSASRWFIVWERSDDDAEEVAAERFAIIMVTLTVASLAYYLFAFQ